MPILQLRNGKGIINQDRYPLKWKSEGPNAKK